MVSTVQEITDFFVGNLPELFVKLADRVKRFRSKQADRFLDFFFERPAGISRAHGYCNHDPGDTVLS